MLIAEHSAPQVNQKCPCNFDKARSLILDQDRNNANSTQVSTVVLIKNPNLIEGGKCIFFPQMVKSMHIFWIFSPIDLKYTKLLKKRLNIIHPLIIIIFSWGKNINQEGGGAKTLISN